jgi:hypothetical protein
MPAQAVQELRHIPFSTLIGGPLKASVEAQAMAAMTTVEFIQRVGFSSSDGDAIFNDDGEEKPESDFGTLRMTTFRYMRKDAQGQLSEAELKVPLLTIVPIPHLNVDEVTINFRANLTDSVQSTHTASLSTSHTYGAKWKAWWSPVRAEFRGSVSTQRNSETKSKYQAEYGMDIQVRASQDDMPAGMARMLKIMEDAIQANGGGNAQANG